MPHPESEHGLRVQLATALRERDEASVALRQERYETHSRERALREALAAANARADAAHEAMLSEARLHAKHYARADAAREALAAARLAYQPICERVCGDDGEHVTACVRLRKALAAPAAAAGEEGTR